MNIRRRNPLPWDQPGSPLAAPLPTALPAPLPAPLLPSRGSGVDVVVPVHGAAAVTRRCLERVVAHTDLSQHRLVVVDDASQEPAIDSLLSTLVARVGDGCLRLTNERRRGFVASVNRGIALSGRDVVLLNSDADVAAGWLPRLAAAAHSAPDVATATPWSNDATLCSFPEPFVANLLPTGWDVDRLAALASERRPVWPRLPTAVGFCMYVRRAAFDRLGLFDEAAFGTGYGEEVDWCLRALAAGYRHVLADDVFVEHAGSQSFGPSRVTRVRAAERRLRRRHPAFVATIAAFMASDPLGPARAELRTAMAARDRPAAAAGDARQAPRIGAAGPAFPRVLHLVHGWPVDNPAGTEVYARELALSQVGHRQVMAYARRADPRRVLGEAVELLDLGVRVRLAVNNFDQRSPWRRNGFDEPLLRRDFARILASFRPDLVHVHHLAGHGISLLGVARDAGVPLLYQIQDWWGLCARANLADHTGHACPGPSLGRCSACLPLTRLPPAPLLNRLLYAVRRHRMAAALRLPLAFVAGSAAVVADYRAAGLLAAGTPVQVRPYGISLPSNATPVRTHSPASGQPLRLGFVGSLLPHKGPQVAVAAFARLPAGAATLDLWGDPTADPSFAASLLVGAPPGLTLRGRFADGEKARVLAALDLLLVPSIGRESFGLVAREALAAGTPVLAARTSGLADLFVPGQGGDYVPPEDVEALVAQLLGVLADRGRLERWRMAIQPVKTFAQHAAEIEEIYDDLWARLRT